MIGNLQKMLHVYDILRKYENKNTIFYVLTHRDVLLRIPHGLISTPIFPPYCILHYME